MLYAFISMQLNTDFVNWWDINVEKENKLVILYYYYFVNCNISLGNILNLPRNKWGNK